MADVVMPRLSDSMEEGTVLKWLKPAGSEVAKGEELVEIETDKATMTYESDLAGVLEIVAAEGDTLPIGALIARIGDGGDAPAGGGAAAAETDAPAEQAPEPAAEAPLEPAAAESQPEEPEPSEPESQQAPEPATAESQPAAPAAAQAPVQDEDRPEGRVKASPLARRLAREQGVDLSRLEGTGIGGRIVRADVEAAAGDGATASPAHAPAASAPAPAQTETGKGETQVEELSRIQKLIARRMAESKATIPEFALTVEVDMEGCVELRSQLKAASADGGAPSYNDMVVKACALALREFPRANGSYQDGRFELYSRINVGVAVAAQDALLVPTVFDADSISLGEIARTTRALAGRVRSGEITPPELSGGTFTVSNLGMFGVSEFTAVINPPQAAILAVGALTQKPVVRDGEIVVRSIMPITLASDHRILYGADAARFLARVRELLETPLALLL